MNISFLFPLLFSKMNEPDKNRIESIFSERQKGAQTAD